VAQGARPGPRARLAALIGPAVAATGYDLEDVQVSQAGRRTLVRVVVDGDDGVSLDAVAEVSRAVSEALDRAESDVGPVGRSPYTLEVTSPGVDRPLTEPRHWRRNAGRLVRVRVGEHAVVGRVVAADDAGVVLDVDGASREVPYAHLGAGTVQIEFGRPTEEDT